MKNKHELNLKITFQTDSDMSDYNTAISEIIRKIHQEFELGLIDDGIIEKDYKIELSGFISVKDKLPEKQGHYLARCPKSFPKNYRGVVAEFYEDNRMFYCESSDSPIEDVTHWMELPDADL